MNPGGIANRSAAGSPIVTPATSVVVIADGFSAPSTYRSSSALSVKHPKAGASHSWLRTIRPADSARARLTAPAACPPGGAYLWVDFRRYTGDDCMPILEKCAASGVLLAPGAAFGEACGGFARLCFTGVPPARLAEGIDRINAVLAGL